jgi:hypothetical protein
MYLCDQGGTGAPLDPRCATPSTVTGLSGKSHNVPADYYALGPSQIKAMDPLGIGPDPASIAYFNQYPLPNDQSVGDNYNYSGYRFAAPAGERDDWLVGRIDYRLTANGNQQLFFRGSGANDHQNQDPFLPNIPAGSELPSGPEQIVLDRSKGFVVGYTAILRSNLVNNFHYGLTRQSLNTMGDSDQAWIYVRGLDQGVTYGDAFTLPVHDFVDDLSWTKGNHTFIFGTDVRLDLGLDKTWKMPYNENHSLEFTWNVFNVPNLTRFDVETASLIYDEANTFGRYTHLLTNPRVMQFGLRYAF